jgi:hypothetical protein
MVSPQVFALTPKRLKNKQYYKPQEKLDSKKKQNTGIKKASRMRGFLCWSTRTRTLKDCTKNSCVTITP